MNSASRYDAIREACAEGNRKLPGLGLVDLTFGNVSVMDRENGVFAIKPSGIDYGKLTPADIVLVDLEGKVVEGRLRPSSDAPTHRRLFQAFPEAGAIVHTHSRNATAFAQAGRPIPCLGTTHADYFHGEIPVTRPMSALEIEKDYEWETGNVIVERFNGTDPLDPSSVPAVLVHGHAPFVWGETATQALETALALEVIAEMTRKALALNPNAPALSPLLVNRHFFRKHGTRTYYGQQG